MKCHGLKDYRVRLGSSPRWHGYIHDSIESSVEGYRIEDMLQEQSNPKALASVSTHMNCAQGFTINKSCKQVVHMEELTLST